MKHSARISALLAAVTTMASSMAFAQAPPAAPPPAPEQGTSPTGQPTSGSEPVQPAVTLGTAPTANPATKDAHTDDAEAPKKKKARPFAGTQVQFYQSVSTATIFKNQQQYDNPTTDSSLWILPRYNINESFQLRGRLIFNYEWTNSDTTTTKNEPRFSDTTISLFYKKIPEVAGFKPMVGINLAIPTSPESRARTMVVTPGISAQVSKMIPKVLGGEIMLLAIGIYSHPFYQYTTPGIRGDAPYEFQCLGGVQCRSQLSGGMNPSDTVAYALLVGGSWGKFSPAMYYLGGHAFTYTAKPVEFQGRPVASNDPSGSAPTVRQTSYFSAWLDYELNDWFTPEVGYWMSRSILDDDGKYGNPFFSRYQDTRVYLGFGMNLDNLAKSLSGESAEGGVIRAKNNRSPMFSF